MREKEDRRVRITKQAIRESLVELMEEQPISKISVKMICERADINRSTFYAHYTDQYDLLKQIQQEVVADLREYLFARKFIGQSNDTIPVLIEVLEYARSNSTLFKVLLNENGDSGFHKELVYIAQQKTVQEIREDKRLDEATSKYLETFYISGCLSILRRWVNDGCADEPAMVAEVITKLLFQGILGFFQ